MPLAIELAATFLRMLSPAEIAQEIEGSLDFLSATVRDLPERHHSMRVVFDQTWQRLSVKEQQVLAQLSVFRGGFSRQAAEQVAGASLPVLSTLVNRTLIRRAMLEESAAILEDLQEKYVLTSVLISLGIVDLESGDHAAARAGFERGLAMAQEIEHPWGVADALTNLGCVYRILGEYSTAQSHLEKALQVYQEHGRGIWETDVRCALAENAISQEDLSTARFHLQAATNLLETYEHKWLQTLVSYFRGLLAHYEGDAAVAMTLLDETTALAREGQFKPDLARSLVALGRVRRTLG